MKATEAILAGVFAGGGSGGGGGTSGVLAIHPDPDTGEFDCTFQDVLNAIDAGKYVFTVSESSSDEYRRNIDPVMETFFDPDEMVYGVSAVSGDTYYAESLDSNPVR